MSCFLDILRCILCIDGDDDREEDTRRRNSNRNYSPYYDTSYRSYVPTTSTATTPLISTHLTRKPSDACTASPIRTPNYSNSWNSTPTKLLDKSRAATQKPTNPLLPPSPSTTKISLNKAVNSATTKTSTPKFPQGLSSFPSQPSAPLTKLLASSSKIQQPSDAFTTTQVPTSISWNSTPTKLPETLNVSFVKPKATIDSSVVIKSEASIRTSDKSCEATQKLKDSILPPSLFSTEISRKKAIDSGTNKSSAQILSHRLSSFSPQSSPSLTKLVASSSKPLPSVSIPPPPPVSSSSSPSFGPPPSSPKPLQPSTKPILSLAPSNPTDQNSKTTYMWVEKGTSPIYAIDSGTNKSSAQILSHRLSSFSPQSSPSLTKLVASSSKPLPSVSMPPPPPVSSSSSSSFGPPPSSPKPLQPSTKPILSLAPSNPTDQNSKTTYIWVEKGTSPIYAIDSGTNKSSAQILSHRLSSFSPQSSPSLTKLVASSSKPLPSVSMPPPPPVSSSSSSSFGPPPSSPKPLQPSTKPILSLAPSNPTDQNSKTTYIWVEKGTSPIYAIPEDFKDLIKNNVVPGILKRPLSPSTYKDYFEALLYAEDFYIEKWDGFEMENVTLELHEAAIYKRKGKYNKKNMNDEKDDIVFVAFEIDSIPEKRPFLLSRDFVSVRPSGTETEPFQGLIYRVVKSNLVLVEFGEDFHDQHYSACEYDVKFSFNRVCLKRAHQAVAAASDPLFRKFLFPDPISKSGLLTAQLQPINSTLDWNQVSAVRHILNHQNAIPYLVEGPLSMYALSRTGFVVCEAVLQVYRTSPSCRILICAPTNKACDVITRKLKEKIQDSDIFRANAAFREFDGVPKDILPSCLYKEEKECFSCPSLQELRKFKVILSTFMSSFRLHNVGIMAGHFSHIFLADASSVTEPEAMVALANLANESTAVTITGAPGNHSGWIRSDIARQNGLLMSYFERLRKSKMYESLDSKLITVL